MSVFDEALEKNGAQFQEDRFIEEMGECIAAIGHYRRGKITREELVNEFHDVMFTAEHFRKIHQVTNREEYNAFFDRVESLKKEVREA